MKKHHIFLIILSLIGINASIAFYNGDDEDFITVTLTELGFEQIELDYKESGRIDAFGNQFKYRAKVRDAQHTQMNRWAWDVFLKVEP